MHTTFYFYGLVDVFYFFRYLWKLIAFFLKKATKNIKLNIILFVLATRQVATISVNYNYTIQLKNFLVKEYPFQKRFYTFLLKNQNRFCGYRTQQKRFYIH